MERFCIVRTLRLGRPNILIYMKDEILLRGDMYSLLYFYYFISPWYKPPSILQITTPPTMILLLMIAMQDNNVPR